MGSSSKILLDFENNNSSTSSIQSKLIVCKNKDQIPSPIQSQPSIDSKPMISSAPKSQVLGKVKDFLGIMSESNKKLQIDAVNNPKEYDIEAITGDEKEYIEFDLMLGVADLHTPEAVAAAESAVSSYQPVIQLDGSSSDSDSDSDCDSEEESKDEDSSSDDDDHDDDDDDDDGGNGGLVSNKSKRSKGNDDEGSSGEVLGNCRLKKRSKIVEIS